MLSLCHTFTPISSSEGFRGSLELLPVPPIPPLNAKRHQGAGRSSQLWRADTSIGSQLDCGHSCSWRQSIKKTGCSSSKPTWATHAVLAGPPGCILSFPTSSGGAAGWSDHSIPGAPQRDRQDPGTARGRPGIGMSKLVLPVARALLCILVVFQKLRGEGCHAGLGGCQFFTRGEPYPWQPLCPAWPPLPS